MNLYRYLTTLEQSSENLYVDIEYVQIKLPTVEYRNSSIVPRQSLDKHEAVSCYRLYADMLEI